MSSYCYVCALILLCMRPHTAIYVSSYCYVCVFILLYAGITPHLSASCNARYSVYLLYWYKRTNTDSRGHRQRELQRAHHQGWRRAAAQVLTLLAFTGTTVRALQVQQRTNTDAPRLSASSLTTAQASWRRATSPPAALAGILSLLALLVQTYKY